MFVLCKDVCCATALYGWSPHFGVKGTVELNFRILFTTVINPWAGQWAYYKTLTMLMAELSLFTSNRQKYEKRAINSLLRQRPDLRNGGPSI